MQVTARIPGEGNKLAGGIPTVADVKGLQLNVSLAGDPEVTPAHLLLRDWGRFQSPRGAFQECPYRRRLPPGAPGLAGLMTGASHDGLDAGTPWHYLWREAGEGGAMRGGAAAGSPPEEVGALQGGGAGGTSVAVLEAAPEAQDASRDVGGPGRVLAGATQLPEGSTEGLRVGGKHEAMLAGIIDQSIANWCAVFAPIVSGNWTRTISTRRHRSDLFDPNEHLWAFHLVLCMQRQRVTIDAESLFLPGEDGVTTGSLVCAQATIGALRLLGQCSLMHLAKTRCLNFAHDS